MNQELVKLAIQSAEEDLSVIADKFLEMDTFTLEDMCWWWNPNKWWECNLKYVRNVFIILIAENCLRHSGNKKYKKTKLFVEILLELTDTEELLNSCKEIV